MKKSRILAAAMASIALTGALVSCGKDEEEYYSDGNMMECVYGPPQSRYEDSSDQQDPPSSDGAEPESYSVSQGD